MLRSEPKVRARVATSVRFSGLIVVSACASLLIVFERCCVQRETKRVLGRAVAAGVAQTREMVLFDLLLDGRGRVVLVGLPPTSRRATIRVVTRIDARIKGLSSFLSRSAFVTIREFTRTRARSPYGFSPQKRLSRSQPRRLSRLVSDHILAVKNQIESVHILAFRERGARALKHSSMRAHSRGSCARMSVHSWRTAAMLSSCRGFEGSAESTWHSKTCTSDPKKGLSLSLDLLTSRRRRERGTDRNVSSARDAARRARRGQSRESSLRRLARYCLRRIFRDFLSLSRKKVRERASVRENAVFVASINNGAAPSLEVGGRLEQMVAHRDEDRARLRAHHVVRYDLLGLRTHTAST